MCHPLDGFPDRLRLPLTFDPAPLAAEFAAFAEGDWTRHYVHDNFEGEWSAIPLRAAGGETHPLRMIGVHRGEWFVDTPFLAGAPALAAALARLLSPLKAARLMRLRPGSAIREHSDHVPEDERPCARVHLPITTNEGVEFHLDGTAVTMMPGSLWYLRLSEPHRAMNAGMTDRVHLVVDLLIDDWFLAQMRDGARAAAA